MQAFRAWCRAFVPAPSAGSRLEQLRAAVGALLGIAVTGIVSGAALGMPQAMVLLLIAPMGASAVLLFAAPTSPLAQPWSIMAGNTVSALIGIACLNLIGYSVLAAAVAVSLAIAVMFALRCLHPPGGASALAAVLAGPALGSALGGFVFVAEVAVNSAAMLATALIFNNLTGRLYPYRADPAAAPPQPATLTVADLTAELKAYDGDTPLGPRELLAIFRAAEKRQSERRGRPAEDLPSRRPAGIAHAR